MPNQTLCVKPEHSTIYLAVEGRETGNVVPSQRDSSKYRAPHKNAFRYFKIIPDSATAKLLTSASHVVGSIFNWDNYMFVKKFL